MHAEANAVTVLDGDCHSRLGDPVAVRVERIDLQRVTGGESRQSPVPAANLQHPLAIKVRHRSDRGGLRALGIAHLHDGENMRLASMDTTDVKAFFDRVASDWDTMRIAYYDERVIDRLADFAELTPDMVVADVGTGTGFVAAGIAPRVERVIAIDISERILDVARRNLDQLGIANVELREGDVTALPLADDSVDAAFANMVLHHAEDPAAMLTEMARVVRPGGVVAICDEVEHQWAWMREEHADIWLGFTPEQVHSFFAAAGLEPPALEALGRQ